MVRLRKAAETHSRSSGAIGVPSAVIRACHATCPWWLANPWKTLMSYRNPAVIATMALLAACTDDGRGPATLQPADIIFLGGNIVTVDAALRDVEAVAVRGDEIVAVGSAPDVVAMRGEATRVVVLGERALVPGFIDAHGHMSFVARLIDFVNLSSPPVGSVESIDDLIELLSDRIAKAGAAPGDWVYGYGYDDSLIAEQRHPTRADLDRVSIEHPIALMHVSGHLATVNSAALKAKNVDGTSQDPPGGVIRRWPGTRQPNGVMEETAAYPFVFEQFGKVAPERLESLFRQSADLHASYGITTVQDGAASLEDVRVFRDAAARRAFPVDIVAFPMANRLDADKVDSIRVDRNYVGGFRVGGIKFVLDGSPQGRTAYLTKPYNEGPPGTDEHYVAYPSYPAQAYNQRVARAIRKGIPVLTHANGDAAIDMLIDGVARAVEGIAMPDHRTVIIHAQLTREDQLHRIKALGLVPSYYAAHPFFWGDWHRRSFGEERAAFISPVGRSLQLAIPLTVHNDAPVVPPDIMRLLWITVNRKTRSGFVLGPEQRATPRQALHAVTLGAAYQYFEEDAKGSITPGKRADLVVLDANPLTVDPDAIKDIGVVETFARGRSVYRRQ